MFFPAISTIVNILEIQVIQLNDKCEDIIRYFMQKLNKPKKKEINKRRLI